MSSRNALLERLLLERCRDGLNDGAVLPRSRLERVPKTYNDRCHIVQISQK